jgi:hypothetical protein
LTVRSPLFRKLLLAAALLIAVTLGSADFLLTRYTAERERSLVQATDGGLPPPDRAGAASAAPPTCSNGPRTPMRKLGSRVTVIDSDGVVLADSRHDPETMENHRARPEVRAALSGRPGSAIRRSATLDIDFLLLRRAGRSARLSGRRSSSGDSSAAGGRLHCAVRMLI